MSELLLRAAFEKDEEWARAAWNRWRDTRSLDTLSPAELATIPLLSRRLPSWVDDDCAKPILLGICKRAWSQNQIRLQNLAVMVGLLETGGLNPVVAGTAATVLLSRRDEDTRAEGACLSIPWLELLLPRKSIPAALKLLEASSWRAHRADLRNVSSAVFLSDDLGNRCVLRWRFLSTAPDVACEVIAIPKIKIEWIGKTFTVPNPGWQLASRLLLPDQPHPVEQSLLLLQQDIDWTDFHGALAWGGTISSSDWNNLTGRIGELRKYVTIPTEVTPVAHRGKFWSIWRDYRRQKNAGCGSFLSYLRTRWDAGSNTELPALALKMLARFWATRRNA